MRKSAIILIRRALLLTSFLLPAFPVMHAQTDDAAQNAQKARHHLDLMVTALGGTQWLSQQNHIYEGRVAAFFQGKPSGGVTDYWETHAWSNGDRIEYTKHRDVVQIYTANEGWEITYRGKSPLPAEQVDDFTRRRNHSIETAVKVWLKDPHTILIYDGQRMAERRLAEQVTLISAQNEAITLQLDEQTHLPLSRSFEWRDPVYKDKNTDTEEYDDYHTIDGFPTPFTITRLKNGSTSSQRYLTHASFNQALPAETFDVEATALRIKK